jgi:hypothetical protein
LSLEKPERSGRLGFSIKGATPTLRFHVAFAPLEKSPMFKTIALIGFGAAIALAPAAALAQYATGYGTYPGQHQNLTPFDRSFNNFNESKREARAGARWVRQHYYGHYGYPRY